MTWSKTVLVIYLFCSSSFFSSSSSSLEISWGGIELLLVQQFESEPNLPSPFWDLINSELSDVVATDMSDMMTDEVVDMSDIIESLEDTDSIEVLRLTDSLPQLKFEKKNIFSCQSTGSRIWKSWQSEFQTFGTKLKRIKSAYKELKHLATPIPKGSPQRSYQINLTNTLPTIWNTCSQ